MKKFLLYCHLLGGKFERLRSLQRGWVRFGVEAGKRSKGGNHCFHRALFLLKGSVPVPKNVAI